MQAEIADQQLPLLVSELKVRPASIFKRQSAVLSLTQYQPCQPRYISCFYHVMNDTSNHPLQGWRARHPYQ